MAKANADGVHTSIELRRTGDDEGEPPKSYNSQDNEILTRTGKKPVLKVRNTLQRLTLLLDSSAYNSQAQFRIHVYLRFQLSRFEHLARSFCVCAMAISGYRGY